MGEPGDPPKAPAPPPGQPTVGTGLWARLRRLFDLGAPATPATNGNGARHLPPVRATSVRGRAKILSTLDPRRPVCPIPPLAAPLKEVEFTPVVPERAFVRIAYNQATSQYAYDIIEPELLPVEREILEFLRDTLIRTMDGAESVRAKDPRAYLAKSADRALEDHGLKVDAVTRERLRYYLARDFLGYGLIDALMHDPMIEDISCNGPSVPVFIFHRQYESMKTNVVFRDEHVLDLFVIRLAQRCGKQISIADPLLDATLPDTSRLQATLSKEVTTRGSSFTIRKFRADPLTPPDLVRLGTYDAKMTAYFWLAMEEGMSLIFAGGTASGKTTTLNALSLFIPPEKKIVTIEDTREINLPHENWVAGLTRAGFGGETVAGRAAGTIDMYKLLETALRQRPEYLLVGEVRGPEAYTLFQAMATGHAAYSTMHADSVQSAVYRLENEPINVPRQMLQTMDAISVQVQVRRDDRMVRRMKEIVEVVGIDSETGDLLTNTVFAWDPATDTYRYLGKSRVLEKILTKHALDPARVDEEWQNRTRVIEWMVARGIRRLPDVAEIVSSYYRAPESVLARVREDAPPPEASTRAA